MNLWWIAHASKIVAEVPWVLILAGVLLKWVKTRDRLVFVQLCGAVLCVSWVPLDWLLFYSIIADPIRSPQLVRICQWVGVALWGSGGIAFGIAFLAQQIRPRASGRAQVAKDGDKGGQSDSTGARLRG